MTKRVLAIGLSTVLISAVPTFALEPESGPAQEFQSLTDVQNPEQLTDTELSKIEGSAPLFTTGQVGLINVNANANITGNQTLNNLTIQNIQVAVLGANKQ